jgi:hypothetical protein
MYKLPCLFVLCLALNSAHMLAETKTILLIGHKPNHPPRIHVYLPTYELLAKCLRQTEGVEAVVFNEWPEDVGNHGAGRRPCSVQ